MPVELEKAAPVELRSLGLDERWLQDQINADPSLLGLGDLEIAGREHRQPLGGRIDFLMRDEEADTFYEVEIMLGALDESHIIRAIEYWDIERQRRPQWEHRAVIVAEQITTRFFNVLRLLNRSVPLIAIKLSAFRIGERVVLHPVTVLNVIEESGDPDVLDPVEKADRPYWEKKSPSTLAVVDKIVSMLRAAKIEARLTFNRGHIALGTTGRNFCWFHRRKGGNCYVVVRFSGDTRDVALAALQESQVEAAALRTERVTFTVSSAHLDVHLAAIEAALRRAEEESR